MEAFGFVGLCFPVILPARTAGPSALPLFGVDGTLGRLEAVQCAIDSFRPGAAVAGEEAGAGWALAGGVFEEAPG